MPFKQTTGMKECLGPITLKVRGGTVWKNESPGIRKKNYTFERKRKNLYQMLQTFHIKFKN